MRRGEERGGGGRRLNASPLGAVTTKTTKNSPALPLRPSPPFLPFHLLARSTAARDPVW